MVYRRYTMKPDFDSTKTQGRSRNAALQACSVVFFTLSALLFFDCLRVQPSDAQCNIWMNPWSPALDQIKNHWTAFDEVTGFLIKSPYLERPLTPQVEALWQASVPLHPISIEKPRLRQLGIRENETELARDGQSVLAVPEVFVDLSCVNFLRKYSHRDDYDYSRDRSMTEISEKQMQQRVDLCLLRMRQNMMCRADTETIFRESMKAMDHSGYDFKSRHSCRNFDDLLDWTKRNSITHISLQL